MWWVRSMPKKRARSIRFNFVDLRAKTVEKCPCRLLLSRALRRECDEFNYPQTGF